MMKEMAYWERLWHFFPLKGIEWRTVINTVIFFHICKYDQREDYETQNMDW